MQLDLRIDDEQAHHFVQDLQAGLDQPTRLVLIWHGGEPLLQSPEFYWQTFERQKRFFKSQNVTVVNVVQTNLVVLDDERIRLLKEGFNGVGVSIDLFGGIRVNLAGKNAEYRVLDNIDRRETRRRPLLASSS